MPLSVRDEKIFRQAYQRYLDRLRSFGVEEPEELASTLAVASVLTKKVVGEVARRERIRRARIR